MCAAQANPANCDIKTEKHELLLISLMALTIETGKRELPQINLNALTIECENVCSAENLPTGRRAQDKSEVYKLEQIMLRALLQAGAMLKFWYELWFVILGIAFLIGKKNSAYNVELRGAAFARRPVE